jgi:hypothetical protein
MKRPDVYKLIDGERDYQDKKWGGEFDDKEWSGGDWIIFIERYVAEAKSKIGYPDVMDSVRKIAALAVACMEYNETKPR